MEAGINGTGFSQKQSDIAEVSEMGDAYTNERMRASLGQENHGL